MVNIDKDSNISIEDNSDFQDLILYRFIIDSLPVAILTVDTDFNVTYFNPWAEKVTGYSAKEVLGEVQGFRRTEAGLCGRCRGRGCRRA